MRWSSWISDAFEAEHRVGGAGQAPFDPKVLLALLIYAYSQGVRLNQALKTINPGPLLSFNTAAPARTTVRDSPFSTVSVRSRRRSAGMCRPVLRALLPTAGAICQGWITKRGPSRSGNN